MSSSEKQHKDSAEKTVREIRRRTGRRHSSEEKIGIVVDSTVRLTDSILRNRFLRTVRLAVGSTGTQRRLGVV